MMRRNPTTIDERTWFYSDAKSLEVIHEIYREDEYAGNARISIPRSLVENIFNQAGNPDELRQLIKYIPAILLAEFEEIAKEVELDKRANEQLKS